MLESLPPSLMNLTFVIPMILSYVYEYKTSVKTQPFII